jgi:hypothetical protein
MTFIFQLTVNTSCLRASVNINGFLFASWYIYSLNAVQRYCSGSCEPGSVYLDLGDPRGSGFWNEGYMGKGRDMGRSVYEQPGNEVDGILSQQGGFQVSKGRRKGSKREWEKGKAVSKGIAQQLHCKLYSCT